MKSFIITSKYNEEDVNKIPQMIELYQYDPLVRPLSDYNSNERFNPMGSLGNNSLAYTIDCSWSDSTNLNLLRETYLKSKNPTISRPFISNRFWVYKITDYGHQSMSPYYQDFIPLVYNEEGYKLNQEAIGMLKIFTTKQAFILLDKTVFTEEPGDLKIRICFKINLEYNGTELISLKKSSEKGVFISEDITTAPLLSSENDYDFFFRERLSGREFRLLNDGSNFLQMEITATDKNGKNSIILPQTGSSTIRDYFTQSLQNDFLKRETLDRDIKYRIKVNTNLEREDGDIILKSRQKSDVLINAKFSKNKTNLYSFSFSNNINFKSVADFSLYKLSDNSKFVKVPSNKITPLFNTSTGLIDSIFIPEDTVGSNKFHIIPEYDNYRRINIVATISSDDMIERILFKKNIFRWHSQAKSLKLIYSDGLLKEEIKNNEKEYDITIIDDMQFINGEYKIPDDITDISDDFFVATSDSHLEYNYINHDEIFGTLYDPNVLVSEGKYDNVKDELFVMDKDTVGMEGLWKGPNLGESETYTDIYFKVDNNFYSINGDTTFIDDYNYLVSKNKKELGDIVSYFNDSGGSLDKIFKYNSNLENLEVINDNAINIGKIDSINNEIETLKNNLRTFLANSDINRLKITDKKISGDFFFIYTILGEGSFLTRIRENDKFGNILYEEYKTLKNDSEIDEVLLPLWDTEKTVYIEHIKLEDDTFDFESFVIR